MRAGIFLTVLADYFLIIDGRFLIGIGLYIAAQVFYNLRINWTGRIWLPAFKFAGGAAIGLYLLFGQNLDLLTTEALVYAWLFGWYLAGAIHTFAGKKMPPVNGLLLLLSAITCLLGDIVIFTMNSGTAFSTRYLRPLSIILWVFYGPSQLLLALSSRDWKREGQGT
jgi:hypothetical protein